MMKQTDRNRNGRWRNVWLPLIALALSAGTVRAHAQDATKPASKIAVQFEGTNIVSQVGPEGPGFQDLVSAQVRTVQTNDILVNVEFQETFSTVNPPGSFEFVAPDVKVLVDGNVISPGRVRFGGQTTRQSPGSGSNTVSLERVDIVSFSFLTGDLPTGVHTIAVQVYLVGTGVGGGSANGSVGKGTMTVETVHVITEPNDIPTLK